MPQPTPHSGPQSDIALACIGLMLADMVERLSQRSTLDQLIEMIEDSGCATSPQPQSAPVTPVSPDAYLFGNHQGQRLRVVG